MKRFLAIIPLLLTACAPAITGVSNFEECVEAGNAVMESYPRLCRTEDGELFREDIGNELDFLDEISMEHPRPNQELKSGDTIKGEARGFWFHEAQMLGVLNDSKGNTLKEIVIRTDEDWMTDDWVPFEVQVDFDNAGMKNGELLIRNENPSGLEENQKELRVPVVF